MEERRTRSAAAITPPSEKQERPRAVRDLHLVGERVTRAALAAAFEVDLGGATRGRFAIHFASFSKRTLLQPLKGRLHSANVGTLPRQVARIA